jgi:hypothetical protein
VLDYDRVPVTSPTPPYRPWLERADSTEEEEMAVRARPPRPVIRHRTRRHDGGQDRPGSAPPGPKATLTERSAAPTADRTARRPVDRADDAMPLIIASVGCAALAVATHLSATPVAIGRLEVWGLFVALAIIAGVGAFVSFLIDDLDELSARPSSVPEAVTSEPTGRVRPLPRRVSKSPALRSRVAGASVRRSEPSAAPPWLESEADVGHAFSVDQAETVPAPNRSLGREPRSTSATSPAEAIAEIDGLWTDLEHLRRPGPRGSVT